MRGGEGGREGQEKFAGVCLVEDLGGLDHCGQVVANFFCAASGQQGDPVFGRVEMVFASEVVAGDGGQREIGERMADECGVDVVVSVEGSSKGR